MSGAPFWRTGKDIGPVYHGGKTKVRVVDPARLQGRDYGFYGEGFYVTRAEKHARSYGKVVTKYEFSPDAKVLVSDLKPEKAHPDLVRRVVAHRRQKGLEKARARGKEAAFLEELRGITTSPLDWKQAVDEYASDMGADAVVHNDGEIVVKAPYRIRATNPPGGRRRRARHGRCKRPSRRSRYAHCRVASPRRFARGSIRTRRVRRGVLVRVGCPKGYWRGGRCGIGMRAVSVLKRANSAAGKSYGYSTGYESGKAAWHVKSGKPKYAGLSERDWEKPRGVDPYADGYRDAFLGRPRTNPPYRMTLVTPSGKHSWVVPSKRRALMDEAEVRKVALYGDRSLSYDRFRKYGLEGPGDMRSLTVEPLPRSRRRATRRKSNRSRR